MHYLFLYLITNTIYNFSKIFLFFFSIKMADIKLKDLYLSKGELKDIMQLVAKKKKYLKSNLKIKKE